MTKSELHPKHKERFEDSDSSRPRPFPENVQTLFETCTIILYVLSIVCSIVAVYSFYIPQDTYLPMAVVLLFSVGSLFFHIIPSFILVLLMSFSPIRKGVRLVCFWASMFAVPCYYWGIRFFFDIV